MMSHRSPFWRFGCVSIAFFSSLVFSATVTIGSKNFTEQMILAEIAAQFLENQGTTVVRKLNLAGSHFTFEALRKGDINIYPEYTGTAYISILKQEKKLDAQDTLAYVKRRFKNEYNLVWSPPLGFNNTYVLAYQRQNPNLQTISTISGLDSILSQLKIGGPPEFFSRSDGFPGLLRHYQLSHPADLQIRLDPGLMYLAVKNKAVDLITAFSTDARIEKYDLETLADNKNYFPPYEAAWLVQKSTASLPAIQNLFRETNNLIDDRLMRELNTKVDLDGASAANVAREFLIKEGLIAESAQKTGLKTTAGYLFRLIKRHLLLSFIAVFFAVISGISLAIFISYHPRLEKFTYSLVNLLQTIPSVALLGLLIPILGIGIYPAIVALFFYSILPIFQNTLSGIKSVSKSLIEVGMTMGMSTQQIFRFIKFPLAWPFIISGIRTASVICIGTTTLAALIGAGGLGEPIFTGISQANSSLILLGAIPSAIIAILTDLILGGFQKRSTRYMNP